MNCHLVIDADDTLWENNIYFERAFDDFYDFLAHSSFTREQVRAIFDEMEIANIRVNGYGSVNFARNLTNCYRHLAERHIHDHDIQHILALGQRILDQPIELMPGVPATLAYLSGRHSLTLFTKGDHEEQRLKVERSGIGHYFARTAIVREKDVAAYQRLVEEHSLDPAVTWMIGNSPKSDINPALAAGLGAVFIPHAHTWTLERQALATATAGRFLHLSAFTDLTIHF
jgi:putative hydrolase of the HAD superfamily